jgi:hypothetical protein
VPSKDPIQRFTDILENIIRIEKFTAGMDVSAFVGDPKTYDAVERCLERISEAASKLGPQAEEFCPGIPWSQIRASETACGMNTTELMARASGSWLSVTWLRGKEPSGRLSASYWQKRVRGSVRPPPDVCAEPFFMKNVGRPRENDPAHTII